MLLVLISIFYDYHITKIRKILINCHYKDVFHANTFSKSGNFILPFSDSDFYNVCTDTKISCKVCQLEV